MKLLFVQPAIGHRKGASYLRSWQMEPLTLSTLAGMTPAHIQRGFYDDRMEPIDFDEPADAVIIPVETYTARRAYEIASEFRRRKVLVIMGGFHVTLVPEEAARYAESIVVGEAENVWLELLDDLAHGTLKKRYQAQGQPDLGSIQPDRSLYSHKRYLPIGLIETGRGCGNVCDFCSVQAFFGPTYRRRPTASVVQELGKLTASHNRFFFVDDNFAGNIAQAKELLRAIIPLRVGNWATQLSVNAAYDTEFLSLLQQSGCRMVLIGFESLNPQTLQRMHKGINLGEHDYSTALENLRRYGIGVFATFVFGYDTDTTDSFEKTLSFAVEQKFFLASFNHLIPFPGTPLHYRLQQENRMPDSSWWLNPSYAFNDVPFIPKNLSAEELREQCFDLRKRFYSVGNIWKRFGRWSRSNSFLAKNYFPLNILHRQECRKRNSYPLGDQNWQGTLLEAER